LKRIQSSSSGNAANVFPSFFLITTLTLDYDVMFKKKNRNIFKNFINFKQDSLLSLKDVLIGTGRMVTGRSL
jgi:hypothetical protein